MKIAVTDACIFIELHDLGLTELFFRLPYEMHTSIDVVNEVLGDQATFLFAFEQSGKLKIHSIAEAERMEIRRSAFPGALSENDKTVLFLAGKLNATVLSSDKAVRKYAKRLGIPYHGILWILDQLFDNRFLCAEDAALKIEQLIARNLFYQNNIELIAEMKKRMALWCTLK
ncbi:hypothetical protein [Dyadobacter sp. 676]|uniref:PIN domain-containing protein n=1 Tax=Dyadobacter sp. 676 TaxID=3088362 RepID=A0AAU8FJ57_9BACT